MGLKVRPPTSTDTLRKPLIGYTCSQWGAGRVTSIEAVFLGYVGGT